MHTQLHFRKAFLGRALEPVEDVWLTIDHGVISDLGVGGPLLGGQTHPAAVAMPGFVDCHVHLALSGGADIQAEANVATSASEAEKMVRVNAIKHLESGVTTVRDLGSPRNVVLGLSEGGALEPGEVPRIIPAGAIGSATGHGSFLSAHADTLAEYIVELQSLAGRGAAVVKLFATGGVITAGTVPGATQMHPELLRAVVEAAHDLGLQVAAHAHGQEGIANAVRAGVDTVEHFSYLSEADVTALSESDTTLISTIVATERYVASPCRHESAPETLAKIIDHAPHERQALKLAARNGVRMGVGTDAGTTFNPHGWGMQEQARHLLEAGRTASSILRALTVDGSAALRLNAGFLDVGMPADLICLGGDPVEDIVALYEVQSVMLAGNWVRRSKHGRPPGKKTPPSPYPR